MRELFTVDPADYMLAICGDAALREMSSPGKSGSFFYLTQDEQFMIKTVKKSEVKVVDLSYYWCTLFYFVSAENSGSGCAVVDSDAAKLLQTCQAIQELSDHEVLCRSLCEAIWWPEGV